MKGKRIFVDVQKRKVCFRSELLGDAGMHENVTSARAYVAMP